MAKIIVPRGQQEAVRRAYPKPAYSRVINLQLQVEEELGAEDFVVSPPIGNRVWLLGIDLNVLNWEVDVVSRGFIYISTGTDKRVNSEVVAVKWEQIIRNYGGPKPGFYYSGIKDHFHWDMMKFYEGTGRRFGVVANSLTDTSKWMVWVSFQISEG